MTATLLPPTTGPVPSPVSPAPAATPHRGLFRLCLVALVWVLPLLVLGAMTTSTGSGMAFRDWPLANGQLWPEMQLDGYLEHLHRFAATFLGMLILGVSVWALKVDQVRWRRWLTISLLGLVVVQGLVGGFGVLRNTPVLMSALHGTLAQAVVALLVFTAFAYSPAWPRPALQLPAGTVRTARKMSKVALVCLFLQLGFGSLGRHGAAEGFRWALWLHVGFAVVVSLVVLIASAYCAARMGRTSAGAGVRTSARWALGLLMAQLTLGFFTLALRSDKDPSNIERLGAAGVVSGHVVIGAALLCTVAMLAYQLHRSVQPESQGSGATP